MFENYIIENNNQMFNKTKALNGIGRNEQNTRLKKFNQTRSKKVIPKPKLNWQNILQGPKFWYPKNQIRTNGVDI